MEGYASARSPSPDGPGRGRGGVGRGDGLHNLTGGTSIICLNLDSLPGVAAGRFVPEDGVNLPEGATVIADHETEAFETSPEEEQQLLEAIVGVERGETVRAADLLERLRR